MPTTIMASLLIKDVRIFTGEEEINNGYVLVSDSKIASFGSSNSIPSSLPPNTLTLSKPGHTLLPGFLDAHIHANGGSELALEQSLRFGVTTVMDMHNEIAHVRKLKKLAGESKDVADFKTSALSATVENGWPIPVITAHDKSEETAKEIATWPRLTNKENVSAYLKQNIADGCDYIKLMQERGAAMGFPPLAHPSESLQSLIVSAAHSHGLKAVAHATCLADTLLVLRAGVDGLTHTFYDQPPTEELVQAYKMNNAWCNPTLAAIGSLTTEGKPIAERFAHDERVKGLIGEVERERMCQCMGFHAESSKVGFAYESVRRLRKEGIDIICGSDAAGPAIGTAWGLSLHHELFLFVDKVGFTPKEALISASSLTAKLFGFGDRGRIAEGLKADLVLVEGNPLEDIDATLNLRGVWRDGVLASVYEGKV
ncbi:hypothetical protein K402DRAFT_390355 [Aulographum hederae CBS 113979]|uniref:Amidohydrolase-related domain-containing protein n=1 Tax=Aulographum hederae CBS 113979 TaxID=1176131 RepID=A0A6G1H9Y4_9PEZI|nr:hypothetical protein K402DRAFT_390355 [Aulographum hederae CBS 113979]